jgi:C-terminal processing protease CtpA/Prc
VIKNGIKEVIELPDKSGELNGYGEYYTRQKNMTYPHTDIVNDVITDGIKYIKKRYRQPYGKVEDIIQKGINKTNWRKVDNHPTYLDHILIKE